MKKELKKRINLITGTHVSLLLEVNMNDDGWDEHNIGTMRSHTRFKSSINRGSCE